MDHSVPVGWPPNRDESLTLWGSSFDVCVTRRAGRGINICSSRYWSSLIANLVSSLVEPTSLGALKWSQINASVFEIEHAKSWHYYANRSRDNYCVQWARLAREVGNWVSRTVQSTVQCTISQPLEIHKLHRMWQKCTIFRTKVGFKKATRSQWVKLQQL